MKVTLIKGEIKLLTFTFNIDIETATFSLICKDKEGETIFTRADGDFDKTEIADKKVKILIDTTTLSIEKYYMELKTAWSGTSIDKSEQYILEIKESLFD